MINDSQSNNNTRPSNDHLRHSFIANISHEFKTPLNGILGFTQILLKTEELDQKYKNEIQIIQQCALHLNEMISKVLDITKIEESKLLITSIDFNLSSFLDQFVKIFTVKAEDKGIQFDYEFDSLLPEFVHFDETRLRQVIMNLISNAIKYTDNGTVSFHVKLLSKNTYHYHIRFQVNDTGIGISQENQSLVFEPFKQVFEENYSKREGLGLGLAITKQLIELFGSKIYLTSTVGKGTSFYFDMIIPKATYLSEHTEGLFNIPFVGYKGERKKILIVDDVSHNREVLVNLLKPLGFLITEVDNAMDAIHIVESTDPHLVLMDLVMPTIDGLTATKRIFLLKKDLAPIIIMVTAHANLKTRFDCLEAGCQDFVMKPYSVEALLEKIGYHLKLDWIQKQAHGQHTSTRQQIIIPPKNILNILYDLSILGDIDGLTHQINDIHEQYPAFSLHLLKLIQSFQLKKIKLFIEEYL